MKIIFEHDFHNTKVLIYFSKEKLSDNQIKKIEKKLCGMSDCSCNLYPITGTSNKFKEILLSKDGELFFKNN